VKSVVFFVCAFWQTWLLEKTPRIPRISPSHTNLCVIFISSSTSESGLIAPYLQTDEDYGIAGEATDGQFTVNLARELRPGVVIMEVSMPGIPHRPV
jgi:hypothetical protein